MWEEKYIPDMSQMTIDEKAGVATALKKLAERRFKQFEKEKDEIIEKTYYFKLVKKLKKETQYSTDKYKEVITYLDSCYSGQKEKRVTRLKEMAKNFTEIQERIDSVRKKAKDANTVIEEKRNAEAVKKIEEEAKKLAEGGGRGPPTTGEKQFKQPTGVLLSRISREFTPLLAQDW